MTQTSTPRPQITPLEAETRVDAALPVDLPDDTPVLTERGPMTLAEALRLRTHARTIVEGEGAEEHDPTLVEAVARAIYAAQGGTGPDDFVLIGDPGVEPRVGKAWEWALPEAHAALSTIRKHQAGE